MNWGQWCGAWRRRPFAKPSRCGMRQPKAMEKEASKRERCRHGAPAPVRGIGQPSVNWRPSRRGRARIWEWLKSWQCAFPKSPTKANRRRGCGEFSPRSAPLKTCASSRPLSVPSTGVSRGRGGQARGTGLCDPRNVPASVAAGGLGEGPRIRGPCHPVLDLLLAGR